MFVKTCCLNVSSFTISKTSKSLKLAFNTFAKFLSSNSSSMIVLACATGAKTNVLFVNFGSSPNTYVKELSTISAARVLFSSLNSFSLL